MTMRRVVNGLVYDTEKAILIAHDRFWDGHNWERRGRNAFLYKTPGGRFFLYRTSMWQGETSYIEPVTVAEAKEWYEALPCQEVPYEEAFGVVPEEA
jgi:hypothetical protein